jgi:hypothetical protein
MEPTSCDNQELLKDLVEELDAASARNPAARELRNILTSAHLRVSVSLPRGISNSGCTAGSFSRTRWHRSKELRRVAWTLADILPTTNSNFCGSPDRRHPNGWHQKESWWAVGQSHSPHAANLTDFVIYPFEILIWFWINCCSQGITVRNEAEGLYIARIMTGSMIERQGAHILDVASFLLCFTYP